MRTFVPGVLALLGLATACSDTATPPLPPPVAKVPSANDVDPGVLAPRMLDDRTEMAAYMLGIPEGTYGVYAVANAGKFYLDDGADVIKGILRGGRRWEPKIDDTLTKLAKRGSTVIDAGAHIGTHSVTLAHAVGPEGRVYAFEPQKKLFRELVFNVRLNGLENVVPLRLAVGDTPGVIEMSPAVYRNEGGTGVGAGGDKAELRTIDSFGFRNVSVMKIDVEGFEDFVLEGARETIAKWRPTIVIEIMGGHTYESAAPDIKARIEKTKAKLDSMGFDVSRLTSHDYLAVPRTTP